MKPKIGICDPRFSYINAASTDLRAAFRKERERIAADAHVAGYKAMIESAQAKADTTVIQGIFDSRRKAE